MIKLGHAQVVSIDKYIYALFTIYCQLIEGGVTGINYKMD